MILIIIVYLSLISSSDEPMYPLLFNLFQIVQYLMLPFRFFLLLSSS